MKALTVYLLIVTILIFIVAIGIHNEYLFIIGIALACITAITNNNDDSNSTMSVVNPYYNGKGH